MQKLRKRNIYEKNQVARLRIKHLARAALHIVTCITGWAQLEFMIDVALEALIGGGSSPPFCDFFRLNGPIRLWDRRI